MKKPKMKKPAAMKKEDPNSFIWINRADDNVNLADDSVQMHEHDEIQGITYYMKNDKVVMWRFEKEKGWTEDTAKIYALSVNHTVEELNASMKSIQEYTSGVPIKKEIRKAVYTNLAKVYDKLGIEKPEFNSQSVYKNINAMDEKMKKLVQLDNDDFIEFIKEAQQTRLDITKSQNKKEEPLFKFFGEVKPIKTITKNDDGTESETWRLKTTFTSNKTDLQYDITSGEAIKKAVDDLNSRGGIAIRFEHESQNYGIWETFSTFEAGGVIYGVAEGELDKSLARSQDLWKEIYDYGKKFATSYGGEWVKYSLMDSDHGVVRVFDEIKLKEISLTTRPANPDTALEVMNKALSKLEMSITDEKINSVISKNMKKKYVFKNEDGTETVIETAVEPTITAPEGTPETPEVKPEEIKEEEKPVVVEEVKTEEKPVEAPATSETDKAMMDLMEKVASKLEAIDSRLSVVENKSMGRKKTIIVDKDGNKSEVKNEEDKKEEEIAKNYPMMSLLMKSLKENNQMVG